MVPPLCNWRSASCVASQLNPKYSKVHVYMAECSATVQRTGVSTCMCACYVIVYVCVCVCCVLVCVCMRLCVLRVLVLVCTCMLKPGYLLQQQMGVWVCTQYRMTSTHSHAVLVCCQVATFLNTVSNISMNTNSCVY